MVEANNVANAKMGGPEEMKDPQELQFATPGVDQNNLNMGM